MNATETADMTAEVRSLPRRGRPSRYDSRTHPKRAMQLRARGFAEADVALGFGVSLTCLKKWKEKHPEFVAALKKGQEELTHKTALRSLYALMNGYEHPEEKIFFTPSAPEDKQVVRVQTTRHYPPNIAAIIFWLCNKLPDEFQSVNKQRIDMNTDGLKELADVLRKGPVPRAS